MTNYERQLQTLIDLIGYQKIVEHMLGTKSDQVQVGIELSHYSDGVLTSTDESTITNL
jgi:hypothetical protein